MSTHRYGLDLLAINLTIWQRQPLLKNIPIFIAFTLLSLGLVSKKLSFRSS